MRVWRLTRQRHVSTAFEGIGSERVGGRWSPRGLRVVYTSESIALCVPRALGPYGSPPDAQPTCCD